MSLLDNHEWGNWHIIPFNPINEKGQGIWLFKYFIKYILAQNIEIEIKIK